MFDKILHVKACVDFEKKPAIKSEERRKGSLTNESIGMKKNIMIF